MTSVSQQVSQPKPEHTVVYKEKSQIRNEAPYAQVWMGKLRQNTTRRTVLRGVNILAYEEKYSYGAP